MEWPYANESDQMAEEVSDVLVLGGGLAGLNAAIAAARMHVKVTLLEKATGFASTMSATSRWSIGRFQTVVSPGR